MNNLKNEIESILAELWLDRTGKYNAEDKLLALFKSEILREYRKWAVTHVPNWETDNLIGDMIGWPKEYKGIARERISQTLENIEKRK